MEQWLEVDSQSNAEQNPLEWSKILKKDSIPSSLQLAARLDAASAHSDGITNLEEGEINLIISPKGKGNQVFSVNSEKRLTAQKLLTSFSGKPAFQIQILLLPPKFKALQCLGQATHWETT